MIIPQGGVHAGSLEANSRHFTGPLLRRLYVLGKMLNPRYSVYRAIERRQCAPDRQARVIAVSNLVRRHLQQFHHVPRKRIHVIPNAIDPERVKVSQPGAVRCGFRNLLGLEPADLVGLFVGHNFALKGLRPLLRALGARTAPVPGRSTCWSAAADTLDLFAGWRGRWGSPRRSISWAFTPTFANVTRRATSSFYPRITTPARWWCWKPWRAGYQSSQRFRTVPAS